MTRSLLCLTLHLTALSLLIGCGSDRPPNAPAPDACASCMPAAGCHFEGGSTCDCGTLVCGDGGGVDASTRDASAQDASMDSGVPDGATADGSPLLPEGGTVVFTDACTPAMCPIPDGSPCFYRGGTICACGALVCMTDCAGSTCTPDEYCAYDVPSSCGGAGTCTPRPTTCPDVYDPGCGCDAVSYVNTCEAHMRGTNIASPGDCAVMADCRGGVCAPGEDCRACADGSHVCLPFGVSC